MTEILCNVASGILLSDTNLLEPMITVNSQDKPSLTSSSNREEPDQSNNYRDYTKLIAEVRDLFHKRLISKVNMD